MRTALAVAIGLALAGCAQPAPSVSEGEGLRYVALGDSYTIGTSVGEDERWPNQLVDRVEELELVGNPAVNGYTSADLIRDELPKLDALRPDIVTVQIGVNDVVRGVPDTQYSANVSQIIDDLLARVVPNRVLCVATPDYTVTPQGARYGVPEIQRAGIIRNNDILRASCEARGVRFVPEIFEMSQAAESDLSLVAGDGLHPSGAQYALWVDAIEPVVRELLAD